MTEWRTVPAESWRDHVEQMLRTWQCRHLNEDGDRLALDDFMGQESIEDLIDFVCDAWSGPAPAPVALTDEEIVALADEHMDHLAYGVPESALIAFSRALLARTGETK